MKQLKRKEHLKKLMFIQHIAISAIVCLGIGFVITKTMAWENSTSRDNAQYINNNFWIQQPSTGDLFDALYSGQTAYTKYMSGYDFQNNSCNKASMEFITYTGGIGYTLLPEIFTGNKIIILNSGVYVNTISQITLSGNCIAIIGSGNITFGGNIIKKNNETKYTIIDNVSYRNNSFVTPNYTVQSGFILQIFSDTFLSYEISGDILPEYATGNIQNQITNMIAIIKNGNNNNTIDIGLFDSYNIINHTKQTIIHDSIIPYLTGVISGTTTSINNGGIYNNSIKIDIYDANLSGITNNGTVLSGTSFIFTNQGVYTILVTDKAGNNTGVNFEIDTTAPSITSLYPSSGNIINTSTFTLSRTTQENTTKIKSQIYYVYSGDTLLTSGTVTPGILNKELPTINNGTYKWQIVLEDLAGNVNTGEASNIKFNKTANIYITPIANQLDGKWYTNGDISLLLSGNKNFTYTIIRSGDIINSSNYIGTTKTEIIPIGLLTGDINIKVPYQTEDGDFGTGIFNFFIDKDTLSVSLLPLGKKTNSTNPINYSRTSNKPDNRIKYYNFLLNGNIIYSGTNKSYTTTGLQVNGTYTAQVRAFDIAGNIGQSTAETTIVDQTPPTIYNVTNNSLYKDLPYPIVRDENNDPIDIIVKKNGIVIASGTKNTPYIVGLEAGEANYSITATDIAGNSTGVNFGIDTTNPNINAISPISGIIITGSNSITFYWSGSDSNLSGFDFNIQGSTYVYYTTGIKTTSNFVTLNNLNNGYYTRKVTAIDKAGNTRTTSDQNFTLSVPLTGQISISGTITIAYVQYSNSETIRVLTNTNRPTIATITGDVIGEYGSNIINKEIAAGNQITTVTMTAGEGRKNIYIQLKDYVDTNTISSSQIVVIDKTNPTKPIVSSINNQNYTGTISLNRPVSIDTGAGIKQYNYQILQNNIEKKSGSTSGNTINIGNMELGTQGSFTIKVQAVDNVDNKSDRSETAIFNYAGIPDTSPDDFTFSRETDALRSRLYRSNTITVTGLSLSTSVKASIDEGTLFLNGIDVDTRAMVKNGDVLYIELDSSDEYDDLTTSTLTIGDKTATYKIITIERNSNSNNNSSDEYDELTDDDIQELDDTYELISSLDNTLKLKFKEMLEDKIDELENDGESDYEIQKLQYIYDRVVEDINGTDDSIYTAPNGKTYIISYNNSLGYTSINFSSNNKTKYFSSLSEIQAFIDKNNKKTTLNYTVDTSRNSSKYTAPNGKVYTIFKTINGQYGSYNMVVPKLFSTLQELKNHIYKNNPRK